MRRIEPEYLNKTWKTMKLMELTFIQWTSNSFKVNCRRPTAWSCPHSANSTPFPQSLLRISTSIATLSQYESEVECWCEIGFWNLTRQNTINNQNKEESWVKKLWQYIPSERIISVYGASRSACPSTSAKCPESFRESSACSSLVYWSKVKRQKCPSYLGVETCTSCRGCNWLRRPLHTTRSATWPCERNATTRFHNAIKNIKLINY